MCVERVQVTAPNILLCRYDSHSGGEREIQRTMLELLNQLDGFDSRGDVKVRNGVRSVRLHAFGMKGFIKILDGLGSRGDVKIRNDVVLDWMA